MASGGGGAAASAAGAAPVANGDIPPGSTVFFGSAYDPSTFAVADKTGKIAQGQTPIVAVGKALAPVDGTGVQVQIAAGGKPKPLRAPVAMDNPAQRVLLRDGSLGRQPDPRHLDRVVRQPGGPGPGVGLPVGRALTG